MSFRGTKFDASAGPSAEEISKYVEKAENDEQLDWAAVRRIIGNLERKAKKNLQDRDKHATEPEKFMDSEIELDEELHRMNIITTLPENYCDMARGTTLVPTLLSLLAHENTDITCSVLGLLNDISDAEVINEDESGKATEVIDVLGENAVLQHLVTTIMRLDVAVEAEAEGVVAALGIVENIIEIDADIVVKDEASHRYLIDWILCTVISPTANTEAFPQYKLYAAEILDMMLHNDGPQQDMGKYTGATKVQRVVQEGEADPKDIFNGTHALLKCLAGYRKREDPSPEEIEFATNIFNCLCRCLMLEANRELFLKADGVQLMILLIKRRKPKKELRNKAKKILLSQFNRLMRESAIRVLSHAVLGQPQACNTLVDSNGLGSVFGIFMLRPRGVEEINTEIPGYVLAILHHCLMALNPERKTRLLRKFLENDFEKVERLIEFFLKFRAKHQGFLRRAAVQRPRSYDDPSRPMDDDELLAEQLNHGLYETQLCVSILAGICTRSRKMLERCETQFKLHGTTIPDVRAQLKDYVDSLVDAEEDAKVREQRKYLSRLHGDFLSQEELQEAKERREKLRQERAETKAMELDDPTLAEPEAEKDFDEEIAIGDVVQDQDNVEDEAALQNEAEADAAAPELVSAVLVPPATSPAAPVAPATGMKADPEMPPAAGAPPAAKVARYISAPPASPSDPPATKCSPSLPPKPTVEGRPAPPKASPAPPAPSSSPAAPTAAASSSPPQPVHRGQSPTPPRWSPAQQEDQRRRKTSCSPSPAHAERPQVPPPHSPPRQRPGSPTAGRPQPRPAGLAEHPKQSGKPKELSVDERKRKRDPARSRSPPKGADRPPHPDLLKHRASSPPMHRDARGHRPDSRSPPRSTTKQRPRSCSRSPPPKSRPAASPPPAKQRQSPASKPFKRSPSSDSDSGSSAATTAEGVTPERHRPRDVAEERPPPTKAAKTDRDQQPPRRPEPGREKENRKAEVKREKPRGGDGEARRDRLPPRTADAPAKPTKQEPRSPSPSRTANKRAAPAKREERSRTKDKESTKPLKSSC
eukprot:GGOE01014369.1.p1 GENE.GGOE01014369.1~~GGOE01014369.1.p1  ORF type:complete len:1046 (-),score=300.18 GGOE01014369.1:208-3345(-)